MSKKLTEIVVSTNFTDILGNLEKELEKLNHISDSLYVGSTQINTGLNTVDIATVTSVSDLCKLMGSLIKQQEAYELGCEVLGLTTYEAFQVSGNLVDNILTNCKLRLSIIQSSDRKKELEELIKEGKQFISKDEQKAAYQQKLSRIMGLS